MGVGQRGFQRYCYEIQDGLSMNVKEWTMLIDDMGFTKGRFKTYEKVIGLHIVSFNSGADYIDCGPVHKDDYVFSGLNIHRLRSDMGVHLGVDQIKWLIKIIEQIDGHRISDKENRRKYNPQVVVKRKLGYSNFHSLNATFYNTYDGILVLIFTLDHQYPSYEVESIVRPRTFVIKLSDLKEILNECRQYL